MLEDFFLPPGVPRPAAAATQQASAVAPPHLAARWTPAALAEVVAALARGGAALRELSDEALLDAWAATVEAFLDPGSPERRQLASHLAALCRLSPAGLDAGLEAVLGGVRRGPAAALLARAAAMRSMAASPVVVFLASNLPALAVQPLLPALAVRRPVLLKSPSAEPLFAPALLAALVRREPRLAGAVAAAAWPGGDAALEAPLLAAAGTILAYGGAEALADLSRRAAAAGRREPDVVLYGPKISIAVIDLADHRRGGAGEGASAGTSTGTSTGASASASTGASAAPLSPEGIAAGLARDVALFDQRGCLSVVAVYVAGGPDAAARLASALAAALADLAARWPPGPTEVAVLAAVQQARLDAELRGLPPVALAPAALAPTALPPAPLPPAAGTVLLEPDPALRPSPGLRTVRVHPLPDLDRLPELLAPWHGRLQGAALAGPAAWRLAPHLAALGISRCAAPGELQSPDAAWHNGGIDPLAVLACGPAEVSSLPSSGT